MKFKLNKKKQLNFYFNDFVLSILYCVHSLLIPYNIKLKYSIYLFAYHILFNGF